MGWTYEAAVAALDAHVNLERLAKGRPEAPTLDRIRRICELMGDPQHAYPAVHVTGTNGKGSTTRMVSALLQVHGLSVGTFTSPHLQRVNERLSWNGDPISDAALAEVLGAVLDLEGPAGVPLSYFELLTAAALRWFADAAVDVAVVEVGLLGRWDATNVIDAQVAVVTNVGLDHTEYAGPTRAHVAAEKAGIVKPGSLLVLGEDDPDLAPIFADTPAATTWVRASDFDCVDNHVAIGGRLVALSTPSAVYREVFVPLHGAHQGDNAAVALAAAEAFFGRPLEEELVEAALAGVVVPGRFEVVGHQPLTILDGAHNIDGARAAATTLADDFAAGGEVILVVGMNRGREPAEILRALGAGRARLIVACAPDWPRAVPAADIGAAARALGVEVEVVPVVADAVARASAAASPDDVVLVTGSLYVVGEARASLALD